MKEIEEVVVKNMLSDVHQGDLEAFELKDDGSLGERRKVDMFQVIESINTPMWGKIKALDTHGEIIINDVYRLNDYLQKIPHGIVDKKRPGIGATTLEINSKRNSIIVVPTKILAYNKHIQYRETTCYVGSEVGEVGIKGGRKEILQYLKTTSATYHKFLVVADSLNKVIEVIGEDVYENYFLLVDEIDILQSDSNFRPALESVMDYYFRFNVKRRALLTATMKEFSNPRLKSECRFDLTDFKNKRNLTLIHTNDIHQVLIQQLEALKQLRVLVAYNSITKIKAIIYGLDEDTRKECRILCSEASKIEAGVYYSVLENNNKLPARITFMTCSYFAGIDIEDSFHLITVSDATKFFQILTVDKMTQIAGRCRLDDGLQSETIIYNTPARRRNPVSHTKESLLKLADNIISVCKSLDKYAENDDEYIRLFDNVKAAIVDKSYYQVMGESIQIIRQDIDGNFVPSYFNIDAILERLEMNLRYSKYPYVLRNELKKTNTVNFISKHFEEQEENVHLLKSVNEQKIMYNEYLEEIISQLQDMNKDDEINRNSLKKLRRQAKRNAQVFIDRFTEIYEYVAFEELIPVLLSIKNDNKKSFKGLKNAIVFWALEDDHPLKLQLNEVFKENVMYSAHDIYEKISPIAEYHFHKRIKPRASVSLFKAFYMVKRPRSKYKILSVNPYQFTGYKNRIERSENLVRYFLL